MGTVLFTAPIFFILFNYPILYLKETDIIFQTISLAM